MEKIGLLPGPVNIRKSTLACLSRVPISHRSEEFMEILAETRGRLRTLVNARECAIFTGSGTLANEVVCAALSRLNGRGIILSNGEFGERLACQARRVSLKFKHLKYNWGCEFDYAEVSECVEKLKPEWLWFVHFETSTCCLNDMKRLLSICKKNKVKLCADVISSIANTPLDLSGLYLAAASSGKGLASVAGLGVVFANHSPEPDESLPKYLDLGFNLKMGGLPFTISSNHVIAMNHELGSLNMDRRIERVDCMGAMIKRAALDSGFKIVGGQNFMLTLELPPHLGSLEFGNYFDEHGIDIHYRSQYLLDRNWIQLALMGYPSLGGVEFFLKLLKRVKSGCTNSAR